MGKEKDSFEKAVVTNRKAYHDYFIEEKFEAGIMLQGTEVKSLREGRVSRETVVRRMIAVARGH